MKTSKRQMNRIILIVSAPIIVIGLLAVLLFSFGSGEDISNPVQGTQGEKVIAGKAEEDPSPTETESNPAPTPTLVSAEEIVAQINQRVIPLDMYMVALSADRAAGALFGSRPSTENDVLEVLVNSELVWQQADAAGYSIRDEDVQHALEGLLDSQGKSMDDLQDALDRERLDLADFLVYYGRLLTVEGFSSQQAQNLGIPVSEYVMGLQSEARISFGPAASISIADEPTETTEQTAPDSRPTPTPPLASLDRGTDPGQLAPNFELPALNANQADFLRLADFAGKPVLLSFWTTWCPYCQAQTPVLAQAFERYADDVQFVGISVREEQQPVQAYVDENGIPYPVLLDTAGQVADLYRISGFPTTYVLDPTGLVLNRHVGQLKPEQVDAFLNQILATNEP